MKEVKLLKNYCLSKGPFVKNNTFYKTLISPSFISKINQTPSTNRQPNNRDIEKELYINTNPKLPFMDDLVDL